MQSRLMIWFPADLDPGCAEVDLHGFFHAETAQVVVIQPDAAIAGRRNLSRGMPRLEARFDEQGWTFHADGWRCGARPYDLDADLFSRHRGLLELASMQSSGVIVCGCGSVGSLAALDLARSGVGRFLLVDEDLLSIENLCRHQCGLADVGRRKVEAVADRIRQINPKALVEVAAMPLEQLDPAVVAAFSDANTLMLACADSRRADRYAARLAASLRLSFLSIGLWERAFAGELFYWHPDQPMPCYSCALEGLDEAMPVRPQSQRRFYSNETDLEALAFQPGLAIEIAHVTQIGLKLALDLLNRNVPSYAPRLLGHLSQYTLVCNTNDPRIGGDAAEIFSHPLQVTTSIQVGFGSSSQSCSCRARGGMD
ncbi:bacterial ThiF/MoeB/HesA protein family [Synechococcus sp. BMK-MC-1]|nr:bacterial ThiF/MoeB/HesA protein family [Synechococcus sp. BMK-MC-1]